MDPTVLTKRPNEETNYLHVNSDHPPQILKQLPKSIEKRFSFLSSSKEIFKETVRTMTSTSQSADTKKS